CWGSNDHGQLGNAGVSAAGINVPVAVEGVADAVAVSTGNRHSCALTVIGAVWCWGFNAAGQLGNGDPTLTDSVVPVRVVVPPAQSVAAGGEHTCAVSSAGAVWCWGNNNSGELGDGTLINSARPVVVGADDALSGIAAVAVGGETSCAVGTDGRAWCWGANDSGQLGNGDPVGDVRRTPQVVPDVAGATAVAVGARHACAVTAAGVSCWGANGSGQTGTGTFSSAERSAHLVARTEGSVTVSAGARHTCAVLRDGTVWCWGDDTFGQLGNDAASTASQPLPGAVIGVTSAVAVSAGAGHSCASRAPEAGGGTWCWGSNDSG
ncbi:MAG TPA: hypothetical protein PLV68_13335, partial [Ilumatobacteraceae bacterium]|nr:hypothetical protein [Ilumatobacteraceae bacterium]